MKKLLIIVVCLCITLSIAACASQITETTTKTVSTNLGYNPIITTGQNASYDKDGKFLEPLEGDSYYGQDAQYCNVQFSFTDNEDGTISDNNTGLMWIAIPDAEKLTYSEAVEYVENLEYAGYDDWRLPTPEELFSISDFSIGWPYLDTDYFKFNESSESSQKEGQPQGGGGPQGGTSKDQAQSAQDSEPQGEAPEGGDYMGQVPEGSTLQGDAQPEAPSGGTHESEKASGPSDSASKEGGQFWTSAISSVEGDERLQGIAFGVNQMTGHIKAYPMESAAMGKYVRAVRGNFYGVENYTLNDDGTTTDNASGLMWTTVDLGVFVDWESALGLAESSEFAGYTDWRLPDVKELQSIVDYSGSYPAVNQEYFNCTVSKENENFYYWTSTSAYFSIQDPDYDSAWYVAFGYTSHGAGAVRFSPKYTESTASSEGEDNILNSVRLVRNVD